MTGIECVECGRGHTGTCSSGRLAVALSVLVRALGESCLPSFVARGRSNPSVAAQHHEQPPQAPSRRLPSQLRPSQRQHTPISHAVCRLASVPSSLSNNLGADSQSLRPLLSSRRLKRARAFLRPRAGTSPRPTRPTPPARPSSWTPYFRATPLHSIPYSHLLVRHYYYVCTPSPAFTMTAANLQLSSPPPSRPRDPTADDLIPRLQALTTSAYTVQEPKPSSQDAIQHTSSPHQQPDSSCPTGQSTTETPPPIDPVESHTESLTHSPPTTTTMGKTAGSFSTDTRRPSTPRAQTDPSPAFDMLPTHHPRPRNRSPYSRAHYRSHSGSSSLSAPPMTRAHSLPAVINPAGHLALSPSPVPARPSSPLRSPKRTRSPRSQPSLYDDSYAHSGAPSVCDISEDAELELTPTPGGSQPSPLSSLYSSTGSLSRRRRPASPLHQVSLGLPTSAPAVRTPTSGSSSPLLAAAKFNEPFPGMNQQYPSSHASSSIPSTPTSMRSRSPSISSLETIPDTPDAEAEAIEADRIARLKAAAEHEKEGESPRRSSLDVPGGSGRALGFGKRDSRKRWSVCGAERRGDLDLETIWED